MTSPARRTRIAYALAASLLVAGCMDGGPPRLAGFEPALPVPARTATLPAPAAMPATGDGAIYHAGQGYAALHEGQRARAVGDLVTILLVERVDASKSTSSKTRRGGNGGITPPASGVLSFLQPDALNAGGDQSFSGSGDARQRSTLDGAVTVTIAEVRPNGTALVVGEKQMQFSQGDEWVQLAGIVRLTDIDYANTVPSTRVADARIIYSGRGSVQQASRPGWLSRFFGAVSPF